MKENPPIICLDTSLKGQHDSIAAYLIPHENGALIIDTGPGSTTNILTAGLKLHGYQPQDVTHVFLTHIHLDHAGAAGWLAGKGAHVYVHPDGIPHLSHPERLMASARRIYGDSMDTLWGEFLPVPESQLSALQDEENIVIGDTRIKALHTPGHANHHIAYVFQETCFTGDVGGMRHPGKTAVNMPIVPPETDLFIWRQSLLKIWNSGCKNIAISHFGIFPDLDEHLSNAQKFLTEIETWLAGIMDKNIDIYALRERYRNWLRQWMDLNHWKTPRQESKEFEREANMGADGLFRYWTKIRKNDDVI